MNELLAHLFGDYVVQSDWMAEQKTSKNGPALAHAVSYAACFLPLTRSPKALAVVGGTHFVIDRWRLAKHLTWLKNQVAPAEFRPGHTATGYSESKPDYLTMWLLFIADNTVHMTINRLALKYL